MRLLRSGFYGWSMVGGGEGIGEPAITGSFLCKCTTGLGNQTGIAPK